jgi:hypothetical protein
MLNQYFWPDFTLIILYIFTVTLTYQISKIFEKNIEQKFVQLGKHIIESYNTHRPPPDAN